MPMGMDSIQSFLLMWTPLTAAMMLPSAVPFLAAYARRARVWPLATAVVIAVYVAVWTVFGLSVYYVSMLVTLPLAPHVALGLAVAFAGLWAFTPVMHAGRSRCIAMCRDVGPHSLRAAPLKGLTYGLCCVACSAGVMVALVVLGMSNVVWLVAGAAVVFLYKLANPWTERFDLALSVALVAAGALIFIT